MTSITNRQKTIFQILLLSLIGASTGAAVKIGVKNIPPLTFALSRAFVSFLILLPLIIKRKTWRIPNKMKLFAFSMLATANITLFAIGVRKTTVSLGAILYSVTPLITAILSYFLYRQKLILRKIIGVLVGFIGAIIIILTPLISQANLNSDILLGNLIIFLAVISFSFHTALSKKIQQQFSPIIITQAFTFTASIILLPLAVWELSSSSFQLFQLEPSSILAIIYVSAIGTIGLYLMYQHIIKKASPLVASLFTYIQPIMGIILGILIFSDKITSGFILGATLALLGVWLVTTKKPK